MSKSHLCIRPCPVCQTHEGSVVADLSYALFDDLKMSGDKKLIQCHTCGMLYDDINFSEDQLKRYYLLNEHYAASTGGGAGSTSDDNKGRYDKVIDILKPAPKGVILDVGCGQGGFISRCIEHGLEGIGIEPATKSREAAKKTGLRVYESIDEFVIKNPDQKVQAVVFSHVVEHMMNPMQLLQSYSTYFNNALVYIEVPDADSYISHNSIRWHEMYFEHLSHFQKHHIAELARHSHIEIKEEGVFSFSRLQEDVRCRFVVGQFHNAPDTAVRDKTLVNTMKFNIPEVPGKTLLRSNRPLALWGVSQYAMLLMGSNRLLSRVRRLFDVSPAKIGRSIGSVKVEHSDRISTLSEETVLVLPRSTFILQMKEILKHNINYTGDVMEI